MERLSIQNIISKIEAEECFHAVASDYSFTIKIDEYVHYACGAVHDGMLRRAARVRSGVAL